MGKLHKIRKAIIANPEAFEKYLHYRTWPYIVSGAFVKNGKVRPTYIGSHQDYVAKVLRGLGRLPEK